MEGEVPNEDAETRRVLIPPCCHVYLVNGLRFRVEGLDVGLRVEG